MREFIKTCCILGFWRTVYLRWFYRAVMRFAHRYNWHYAPTHGPFEDGSKQQWCEWCGMRHTIPPMRDTLGEDDG